jgi:hypothetical protein
MFASGTKSAWDCLIPRLLQNVAAVTKQINKEKTNHASQNHDRLGRAGSVLRVLDWHEAFLAKIGMKPFLQTAIADFDKITRRQALCNAIAAFCAGVAAVLQIATTGFMPVCRAFG